MSETLTRKTRIQTLLDTALGTYTFSGYQVIAATPAGKPLEFFGGQTSYWPGSKSVTADTWFDIASTTKVIATASILARLVDRGEIRLGQTVEELRPEFKNTGFAQLTLQDLACHRAGIKSWYPIYAEIGSSDLASWFKKKADQMIKKDRKEEYSDLSILLLWLALEKKAGVIEEAFQKEVVAPLQLKNVAFGPVPSQDTAATEYCAWRKKLLQGEVFDENARVLGHKAPHAGLFASAQALAPWCQEWLQAILGKSRWISKETAVLFTSRVAGRGVRGIGFDRKSEVGSTLGEKFSNQTFGHLGYTGCSVWMDPEVSGYVICLTNRVHPSRYNEQMRKFRIALHTEIASLWREGEGV